MIKDFFEQSQEAVGRLRSQYFKMNNYLEKGQYHMKPSYVNQGKLHYDFDLNSQEYFHQKLDDIIYQKPEVQEAFYDHTRKFLQSELNINSGTALPSETLEDRCRVGWYNNLPEAKQRLILHFEARLNTLSYKKYQTLLRFHNSLQSNTCNLKILKSRIQLIDCEIQSVVSRLSRLKTPDDFAFSSQKPVPVNQNENVIYKILDQEESSYANISRDDIEVYLRSQGHQINVLSPYWEVYYSLKHLDLEAGLDSADRTEIDFFEDAQRDSKAMGEWCSTLVKIVEKQTQPHKHTQISSIDNVQILFNSFYGVTNNQPLMIPILPSISQELIANINYSMLPYFDKLISDTSSLSDLVPKLLNFASIVFRYQNQNVVVQEQEDIKLGLEDDVDLQKQLLTLLELVWVNKYVRLPYERYNVKLQLVRSDWPQNSYTRKQQTKRDEFVDLTTKEIIKSIDINNYNIWRRYIKTHSESVVKRSPTKFRDLESCIQYQLHSDSDITIAYLNKLYHTKKEVNPPPDSLKKVDRQILESTFQKLSINNPVFVQSYQSLCALRMRDVKSTLRNVLNANRCFFKRLSMDLRTLSKYTFKYQCQDDFLVDTNKQQRDNIDRQVKQSPSVFSVISLKKNESRAVTDQEIEQQLSQHAIYSYDKVKKEFFGDQRIPELYVCSAYRSKKYILYDVTLQDLKDVQGRLLVTASRYIRKIQGYVQTNLLQPIVDRYKLLKELYEYELKYQFEKFRKIQVLVEIYQHTPDPLNNYKIMNKIFQQMRVEPRMDFEQNYFASSYQKEIEILQCETNILEKTKEFILNEEVQEVNQFHKRLKKSIGIPYHQYGVLYGDIESQQNKTQRRQSQVSMSSRSSPTGRMRNRFQSVEFGIKQQNQDQSQEIELLEGTFNLKNYDEYLLTKDLDQIFEEMAGARSEAQYTDAREEINESNINIHRRAQGGPHCLIELDHQSQIKLLSGGSVEFVNFFQKICWSVNILSVINTSVKKTTKAFSQNKKVLYELYLKRNLLKKATELVESSIGGKTKRANREINWDDSYHLVTKSLNKYKQLMKTSLEPSQSIVTAHSLSRVLQYLPQYGQLQYLDIHSLQCLVELKQPKNTILYRQLFLGINLMEVFRLSQDMNRSIMERDKISQIYKQLGRYLRVEVTSQTMEYQRELRFVTEELKITRKYGLNLLFPAAVQSLKVGTLAQKANVENFLSLVRFHQIRTRKVLWMQREMNMFLKHKRFFSNGVMDKGRISIELSNIKNLGSRMGPLVGYIGSNFRESSYLSSKKNMLTSFEEQFSKAHLCFIQNDQKAAKYLNEKKLGMMKQELATRFYRDMIRTAQKRLEFLQTVEYNQQLAQKAFGLPFNGIWTQHPFTNYLQEKFYFDQKDPRSYVEPFGKTLNGNIVIEPLYLHTQQQLFQQYSQKQEAQSLQAFDHKAYLNIINLQANITRQDVYKKVLGSFPGEQSQHKALQFICQLNKPISGYPTIYSQFKTAGLSHQYKQSSNYKKTLEYYRHLNDYIDANIIQIALSSDDVILLGDILNSGKSFEKVYPITQTNQLYGSLSTNNISAMYAYQAKQYQLLIKARSSSCRSVVIDQLTDFLVRRVQGLGLLRQLFLPFAEELSSMQSRFRGKEYTEAVQFLGMKTRNIYKLFNVTISESCRNNQDPKQFKDLASLSTVLFSSHKPAPLFLTSCQPKLGITTQVSDDLNQHYRFNKKIVPKIDILNRLHFALITTPLDFDEYIVKYVNGLAGGYSYSPRRQADQSKGGLVSNVLGILNHMGNGNRLRFLSQIKYVNENLKQILMLKKTNDWKALEEQRERLLNLEVETNIVLNSIITLGLKDVCDFPLSQKRQNQLYQKQFQEIDTKATVVVNNYDQYMSLGKLTLTSEQKIILTTPCPLNTKDWTVRQLDVYKLTLKKVTMNKLVKEFYKVKLVDTCIDMVQKQRIPKNEMGKVVNINLVPRVKLNSCYSSPLRHDRKNYVSNTHKIAFVQAFINRLRNKVSRVDLLSSGYGFVITVADLENCVNFLNKSLFSFTQKEFKHRMQTFSLYWQMMTGALNLKNKEIVELKTKVNYLRDRVDNINQTAFLKKASNLLNENSKLNIALQEIQKASEGLEDRTRKIVEIEYHNQIQRLTKENQIVRQKFRQFQGLLVLLAKDQTKHSFTTLLAELKHRSSDILQKNIEIDIEPINNFPARSYSPEQSPVRQTERPNTYNAEQQDNDSYQSAKIINKMRMFNILKVGTVKEKQFKDEQRLKKELKELKSIHDDVVVKTGKEIVMRKELDSLQIMLANKMKELEMYKTKCALIQNQNDKLRTWKTAKERVIENLKNSVLVNESLYQQKPIMSLTKRSEAKSQKIPQPKRSFSLKKKQTVTHMTVKLPSTQPLLIDSSFQLSNKQVVWKQKCEQLFMDNKRLQKLAQRLKSQVLDLKSRNIVTPVDEYIPSGQLSREQISNNEYEKPPSSRRKRFPNLSFKYKMSANQM